MTYKNTGSITGIENANYANAIEDAGSIKV